VLKTVLLVIEVKYLSPFFRLAALILAAKAQFFLGHLRLSWKFNGRWLA